MRLSLIGILCIVVGFTACTNENLVADPEVQNPVETESLQPVTFSIGTKNSSRAIALEQLQDNFGVFGYKTMSGQLEEVMNDYLVGYYGEDSNGKKYGYKPADDDVKPTEWFYEGLGKDEYSADNSKGDNFVTASKSKNSKQILRLWDKYASNYEFYGYSPYGADVTCDPANHAMTMITLMHADASTAESETMVAYNKVAPTSYGNDVSLEFRRLCAKVRIAFYEDIPGYKVNMVNLVDGTDAVGVAAQPADEKSSESTRAASGWQKGKITTACKVNCQFNPESPKDIKFSFSKLDDDEFRESGAQQPDDYMKFEAPKGSEWTLNGNAYKVIAETKDADKGGCLATGSTSRSATNYFCVPAREDEQNSGLTFRMSFQLIAEDNGEVINVKDAGVFVAPAYTQWKNNTVYTYVFKITKETTGRTPGEGGVITVDPSDPDPGEKYLYPIVFDNLTVEPFSEDDHAESEWTVGK